jgi:hypothetical protein
METTTAVHTKYRTERHLPSAEQGAMVMGGTGIRNVIVDGKTVGQYAKNKYGVWIGHCDPDATNDRNPFITTSQNGKMVAPAARFLGRTCEDLCQDIADGKVWH